MRNGDYKYRSLYGLPKSLITIPGLHYIAAKLNLWDRLYRAVINPELICVQRMTP